MGKPASGLLTFCSASQAGLHTVDFFFFFNIGSGSRCWATKEKESYSQKWPSLTSLDWPAVVPRSDLGYHGDPDLASWTSSQLSHMRPSCPLSESSDSLLAAEAIIPSFSLEALIAVNNHRVLGILHTIAFISQEVRGSTVSHRG